MSFIKITDEIKLRIPRDTDATEHFALVKKNRAMLNDYFEWTIKYDSQEESAKWITSARVGIETKSKWEFLITFEDKIIGTAGFNNLDNLNKKGEIGYWIDKDFQGKGIVSKVTKRLLKLGFEDFSVNRITIKVREDNTKSQHIPKTLGFSMEGVLRHDTCRNNQVYNTFVYSLLKEEWAEKYPEDVKDENESRVYKH